MNVDSFLAAFSLEGEVALVTGAGSGLGLAAARCLAAAGSQVALVGRRPDVLAAAAHSIGPLAAAFPCDIRQTDALPDLLRQVEARLGPLTILVNNAGTHLKKPALETTPAEFASLLDIHLTASFALSRLAAQAMIPRRKGSLVFIASMAALFGVPQVAAYSAAKSGLIGLLRALAVEWSPFGLRVNAVAPGWIDSGVARQVLAADPDRKQRILARTPLGRLGQPEDVGWGVVYLCSPAAAFVTGHTLVIDGGAAIGF